MYNIALHIKLKDWLYILLIGVLFGMFLSWLGYILLEYPWFDGTIFGLLLGFSITLFSLIFISYMNKKVLPKLNKRYWLPISILCSFLSGFLGAHVGVFEAKILHIKLIPAFESEIGLIAIIIGILTYIVGALLYRFVKMRNQKDVIDYEYVQSRLRSLETQLNPHFLFNALNSIAELIHHDKDKAEMAVLKVSSFLRNTMNEKALLCMQDEIRNVKDYVELENIRFSGKIKLHIADDLPNWNIPKFSIQLLVENGIKHGYNPKNELLNIWLYFEEKEKRVVLKNDGNEMKSKKFGIGLNNLNQRIELLCQGKIEIKNLQEPTFYIYIGACHENINC